RGPRPIAPWHLESDQDELSLQLAHRLVEPDAVVDQLGDQPLQPAAQRLPPRQVRALRRLCEREAGILPQAVAWTAALEAGPPVAREACAVSSRAVAPLSAEDRLAL